LYTFSKIFLLKGFLSLLFTFKTTIYAQPRTTDYLRVGAELTFFLHTQFFYHQVNIKPNITPPNSFDSFLREKIHWGNSKNELAAEISDVLLYGVILGSIPLSSVYLKDQDFLLINLEILSINGIITNIVKYAAQRRRPYSFYSKKNDDDSYKSFFSGHTSTSFAIGTSTAKMLAKYSDTNERIVWLSALGLASATGYLRIAADKHYFSDVFAGAIVGTIVGNTMFHKLTKRYQKKSVHKKYSSKFYFSFHRVGVSIPL